MPKTPAFEHTCHRCRTAFYADEPDDGSNSFCPACLTQNLRDVERSFFEDYIYFGAKARSTSARVYLNLFESTDDVRVRKFAGLSIYEQFILATEDLAMVNFALRNREQKPLLDTLLGLS
jgi:rRNA maturation endonuclease Nob1